MRKVYRKSVFLAGPMKVMPATAFTQATLNLLRMGATRVGNARSIVGPLLDGGASDYDLSTALMSHLTGHTVVPECDGATGEYTREVLSRNYDMVVMLSPGSDATSSVVMQAAALAGIPVCGMEEVC